MSKIEIEVVDSHTAGEPTRVIVDGGPGFDLAESSGETIAERTVRFRESFDRYRTATVTEPRGSDVLVGALLCAAADASCDAGVIFFNNIGYLGMCGHGMIGVVETLRYLGRIDGGTCRLETPVGVVAATLGDDGRVSIVNVESYRTDADVRVDVDGIGEVVGDVAWGGNPFFLVKSPTFSIHRDRVRSLQAAASAIRDAVHAAGHDQVDHVELFAESPPPDVDSQNFVLCPGLEYDRSPCGTGTSAKLACLAADGKLSEGQAWIQAGVLGTTFEAQFEWVDRDAGRIRPIITAAAHVTGRSRLIIQDDDPFAWGIS